MKCIPELLLLLLDVGREAQSHVLSQGAAVTQSHERGHCPLAVDEPEQRSGPELPLDLGQRRCCVTGMGGIALLAPLEDRGQQRDGGDLLVRVLEHRLRLRSGIGIGIGIGI
jgi:hypothetical protein